MKDLEGFEKYLNEMAGDQRSNCALAMLDKYRETQKANDPIGTSKRVISPFGKRGWVVVRREGQVLVLWDTGFSGWMRPDELQPETDTAW